MQPSLQGKMSRVLAAKCALSIRVDAMGDSPEPTIGLESRQMVRTPRCPQLLHPPHRLGKPSYAWVPLLARSSVASLRACLF